MKFSIIEDGVDPDLCFWRESGEYNKCFINVIRIYYEVGSPAMEEIGFCFIHFNFLKKKSTLNLLIILGVVHHYHHFHL